MIGLAETQTKIRHGAGTFLVARRNLELCPLTLPELQAEVSEDDLMVALVRSSVETGHGGKWSLPKGKRKTGEGVFKAAVRETAEETGHDAQPECVLAEYRRKGGAVVVAVCLALERNPQQPTAETPDIAEAAWVPLSQVQNYLGHAAARTCAQEITGDTDTMWYIRNELMRPAAAPLTQNNCALAT